MNNPPVRPARMGRDMPRSLQTTSTPRLAKKRQKESRDDGSDIIVGPGHGVSGGPVEVYLPDASVLDDGARVEEAKGDPISLSKRNSLTEKAYQTVKGRILTATYMPGQFLQENTICYDIGIGRTPVHQALQRLMIEDLVQVIPRKGVLIRMDSLMQIKMALELRSVLEPYCALRAAALITDKQLDDLKKIVEQGTAAVEQAASSKYDLMVNDRQFHYIITAAAGNPMFADCLRPVHERLNRFWFQPEWSHNDFALTEGEHDAILEALMKRDPEGAARAMKRHIHSLNDRLISKMSNVGLTDTA